MVGVIARTRNRVLDQLAVKLPRTVEKYFGACVERLLKHSRGADGPFVYLVGIAVDLVEIRGATHICREYPKGEKQVYVSFHNHNLFRIPV